MLPNFSDRHMYLYANVNKESSVWRYLPPLFLLQQSLLVGILSETVFSNIITTNFWTVNCLPMQVIFQNLYLFKLKIVHLVILWFLVLHFPQDRGKRKAFGVNSSDTLKPPQHTTNSWLFTGTHQSVLSFLRIRTMTLLPLYLQKHKQVNNTLEAVSKYCTSIPPRTQQNYACCLI